MDETEKGLVDILLRDFSVRREVFSHSLICYDIGICDGEFQEFMALAEERFDLKLPSPCPLPFKEEEASIEIVADWIKLQQRE
ncbi:hypothetical protein FPZ54_09100 [Sphingomonas suaedae]|uniref:Uncharacterized protein n=1 Tax=Sphingomonas suaedae TaxID=2599297 RepID=A0A518RFC4_9SPHN|nr:hypothetical protein [Sphingomonas suaedae]QDX26162.1 hypothetical protein FPZ54_09100 [Sphingomonas suaedae]